MEYPIDRYAMETKRQLAKRDYTYGADYTIADIDIWCGQLVIGDSYQSSEFFSTGSYVHVNHWARQIKERTAFKRSRCVNRGWGAEHRKLKERHSASDINALK
jgi:GST-like protein